MSSSQELPDDVEQYEETAVESVEMRYARGELSAIVIETSYETGTRTKHINGSGNVDRRYEVKAKYVVSDGEVTIKGFYPDTTRTGEDLWRENLRAIAALDRGYRELNNRLGDEYIVHEPLAEIADQYDLEFDTSSHSDDSE